MKIAYLISWDLSRGDGVSQKVAQQIETWRELGHDVQVFEVYVDLSPSNRKNTGISYIFEAIQWAWSRISSRRKLFNNQVAAITEWNPDIVYNRWEFFKSRMLKLMRRYAFVIELNSDMEGELRGKSCSSFLWWLRFRYYMITRRLYYGQASGYVAVTQEIAELDLIKQFAKPTAVIPNSVPYSRYKLLKPRNKNPCNCPKVLILCSGGQPWHGLDLLLSFAKSTIGKLVFVIVGADDLACSGENIEVHGFCQGQELEDIMSACDVGLGSIALFRNEMGEACPLKTRSYVVSGLPLILPYKETALRATGSLWWKLEIPNCESGLLVSRDKIIDYCNRVQGKRVSHEESAEYFDSLQVEQKRLMFLEEIARIPKCN